MSYFNPNTGEHWSGRSYYNTTSQMGAPDFIISEYRYRQLLRQAPAEVRGEIAMYRQSEGVANQRAADRNIMQNAMAGGLSRQEAQELMQQRALYDWWRTNDPSARGSINQPGSPLANALEELGLRPAGASWPVGTSPKALGLILTNEALVWNGMTFEGFTYADWVALSPQDRMQYNRDYYEGEIE